MHPRSRHQEYLDYRDLAARQPSLIPFVYTNPYGGTSIDYTDQRALKELTRCLLRELYGVVEWSIPDGYLCPPVPQRADYIHGMADLLVPEQPGQSQASASSTGLAKSLSPARGPGIRGLDVGTGASCIYCLLGAHEYGWNFIGSDIDAGALKNARAIVKQNGLADRIKLRRQQDPTRIFHNVLRSGETIAFCVCNPPFHESLQHAHWSAGAKWRRLGRQAQGAELNYQGQPSELWCEGGEVGFVSKMAEESAQAHLRDACLWFSSMLSRESSMSPVWTLLGELGAKRRNWELQQGRMTKWIIAWTFVGRREREARLVEMVGQGTQKNSFAEHSDDAGRQHSLATDKDVVAHLELQETYEDHQEEEEGAHSCCRAQPQCNAAEQEKDEKDREVLRGLKRRKHDGSGGSTEKIGRAHV